MPSLKGKIVCVCVIRSDNVCVWIPDTPTIQSQLMCAEDDGMCVSSIPVCVCVCVCVIRSDNVCVWIPDTPTIQSQLMCAEDDGMCVSSIPVCVCVCVCVCVYTSALFVEQ